MMYATKIKMKQSCASSNNLLEIDSIYLTGYGSDCYYKKDVLHEHLRQFSGSIKVNISPYPDLIPATGPAPNYEKYVKSTPNSSLVDNLLCLSRE